MTFAVDGCANCAGKGYTGTETAPTGICSCAALAFRREFVETGRIRQRQQLGPGGQMRTWQEYAAMAIVVDVPKLNSDGA